MTDPRPAPQWTKFGALEGYVLRRQGERPRGTMVWLHGRGAQAGDLVPLALEAGLGHWDQIFPQAPLAMEGWTNAWQWFDLEGDIAHGLEEARGYLDNLDLAEGPLCWLGFSQGGGLALEAAVHGSQRALGAASLSGFLGRSPKPGQNLEGTRFFLAHGNLDPVLDPGLSRQAALELEQARAQVEFKEYNMAHEICPQEAADLAAFLRGLDQTQESS